MKSVKQFLKLLVVVTLFCNFAYAQDEEPTMYNVHTDFVNFDKLAQYEQVAKELKDNCIKHGVKNMSWLTVSTEDGRYMYVSQVDNMAELDTNVMAELREKMGKEAVGAMLNKMDECYDAHGNEIVHYLPGLSYNPEGYSREGMNEREYHFLYYSPKNGGALGDAIEKIKELFTAKGVKNGYNVYHSGFGSDESYFMVAVAGKSALHIAQTGEDNDVLLGEGKDAVFFEMIQLTSKYDQVNGTIRPDLSYSPTKE
ncbi:hypothetical protein [Psychroserpens jangbogonensis]|uniref:hypothetical protein n=1 Tax=Psychroserpens jangbogonensis TaxID=1484460 RepID=UPI00053E87BC|nr:hypothetical protein [Psychroserpens jangbogonensis]